MPIVTNDSPLLIAEANIAQTWMIAAAATIVGVLLLLMILAWRQLRRASRPSMR